MRKVFLLLILSTVSHLYSQEKDTIYTQKVLPFHIDDSKRMPQFELQEKKEGTFITGLPRFEFDPIRGFGVGGNINLYFNKTQEDPFFEYTPYRHKLNAEFFIFENGRVRYALNYDAPYIFDSPWRLRADLVVWEDPEAQYWGMGRSTLNPLRFRDKTTGVIRNFNKIADYEDNLSLAEMASDGNYYTDHHFNQMHQDEVLVNALLERTFFGGKLRLMFGYEALFTRFQSFGGKIAEEAFDVNTGQEVEAINNPTLVDIHLQDGTWDKFNLGGFNNDGRYLFTSMIGTALIYDTRDFEPDPSKGVLLEYAQEFSAPWLGSDFSFLKYAVIAQYFHTIHRWRNDKSRLTFAGAASFRHVFGSNINFIELWDLSSQVEAGGVMLLGGERSIRGYREARFMAPTIGLVNLELRSRFYDFRMFNQHFTLGANVFYDFGTVWDSPSKMSFTNWVGAPGLGARIGWNQSTVLRLDFAQSREGSQFFFGFGHIF
jgi:hypothetical protein